MQTKIEGILIQKIPYRERDLIGTLLLRSGKKVSVIFYGGRSGGKRYRSSTLEMGHLLNVEIKRPKILNSETLLEAKEWTLKWNHNHIRNSVNAFYLLTFYIELINKVSVKDDLSFVGLSDGFKESEESIATFRVMSNAIFHLDNSLSNNSFNSDSHFQIFLGKLIFELGITPEMTQCVYCGKEFNFTDFDNMPRKFVVPDGGFSCLSCMNANEKNVDDSSLFKFLSVLKKTSYAKSDQIQNFNREISKMLFHHVSYHCNLGVSRFNTLKNFM